MVKIIIEGRRWRCPTSWSEITVAKGREINRVIKQTNSDTREIIANPERPQILSDQQKEELRKCHLNIITILAEIPLEIVEKIEPLQLANFTHKYIAPLIGDMESGTVVVYHKNKSERGDIPCGKLSAAQFCEATDLYIEDRLENAKQIAKIVLGRGEKIGDRTTMKRIWSAFDRLSQAHREIKESFPESHRKHQNREIVSHWRELPIVIAKGVVSEIELVKKMRYRQMMEILECQVKMDQRGE